MGASTWKWTNHDPSLGFNDSESKLYTSFEFCEEKYYKHLKKQSNLQSQANRDDKKFQDKSTYIV
jgi:hypothetical protein